MYQKKPSSRPSTTNPDGVFSVMVEIRIDRTRGAHAIAAGASLPTRIQRDESFDPVDMDGGTTILRYNVRNQTDVETLKRLPGVVAVWTDTPIEPMTPR